MATDICLPILKFSEATGVKPDNSIPWTHLTAQNLFVLIRGENTDITDGHLTLRVVHANVTLESIDVADYVDKAVEARRGAELAGVTPQVEQLPIFGITKESLLALRYRLSDGQVPRARRLQLRMQSPAECRQIVSILERRGMEFQEQRPRTARPGTARPATSEMLSRPSTMQYASPHFESSKPASRPSPFHPQVLEAGSLSRTPSLSPEKTFSQEMPPPSFLVRDENAAPRNISPTRPSTAPIYRSYTTPSQPSRYEEHIVDRRISDPLGDRPSSSYHGPSLDAVPEGAVEHSSSGRTISEMPPPSLRLSHSNEQLSSTANVRSDTALLSSEEQRPATARPSTATSINMLEELEHEIPPRRELPFKRAGSGHTGSDKSGSRPGTSALTMPPLPRPKLAREGSGSPTKDPGGSRPGTASPLKRSFTVEEDKAERPQTAASSASVVQAIASKAQSPVRVMSPPTKPVSPVSLTARPSRMDELLYGRKPFSEQSINTRVPRISSLIDAHYEEVTPPATAVSPTRSNAMPGSVSPIRLTENTADPTVNVHAAITSSATNEVSLAEWAAQSPEDRAAALDEFMIAHLDDPSFTTLCEDVENCWRRIALGL